MRLLIWIGRHELATLVLLAIVVAGFWGFIELADEVSEGSTAAFDRMVILALRNPEDLSDPLGPEWVEVFARDITALGGYAIAVVLVLAASGFLLLQHKRFWTLYMLVAIGGGALLVFLLKLGFARPRPDLVAHAVDVHTASFPSGHSATAAMTFLTIGALLARTQPRLRLKAYLLLVAMLLVIAVGISRVYLGVHWPTDVLAGWTTGAVWAVLSWLVARWLQRRGRLEHERARPDME